MKKTTKKIKSIKFTLKHKLTDIEDTVNAAIDELVAKDCKVVNITRYVVHSQVIYIVYDIMYETAIE